MAERQTVVCALPRGRLRYSFSGPCGETGLTVRFAGGAERRFEGADLRALYERIRSGVTEPLSGVEEIETGYGPDGYDSLYCAMRLLGHDPVARHRSRTYKTGLVECDERPHNEHLVWHRFAFSGGRLPEGLSKLLLAVYGVSPPIALA